MNPKQRSRIARKLRRAAADVESGAAVNIHEADDGAIAAANTFDVDELLYVINHWGEPCPADFPGTAVAPVPPPVVEPPPSGGMETIGPLILGAGVHEYRNKRIFASRHINDGKAVSCIGGTLRLIDCIVEGWNYGIWYEGPSIDLLRCKVYGGAGGDDYAIRAYPAKYRSDGCHFENIDTGPDDGDKAVWRVMNCIDLESADDTFIGSRMMIGGGPATESVGQLPLAGSFHRPTVKCDKVEVYSKTDVLVHKGILTGSGRTTNWNGGKSKWIECIKDGRPLNLNDFQQNDGLTGITFT